MEGWREGREVTEMAEGEREALIRHSDLEDERRVPACEYASERASTQTRPSAPPQRLRSPHISPLIPATINKSKTRSTDDWPQWSPEGPAELPLTLIGCRKKKRRRKGRSGPPLEPYLTHFKRCVFTSHVVPAELSSRSGMCSPDGAWTRISYVSSILSVNLESPVF